MSRISSNSSEPPRASSPFQINRDKLTVAAAKGWKPPPRVSIVEWADTRRKQKDGSDFRTATVEVARGPMLAVTEPGVHIITAMVATQLLKTTLLENVFGFHADYDPCDMLLVQPKEDAAEQFSKERIAPLIASTPVLRQLIGTSKTRKSEETLLYKSFPGGFLALVGAGSPDNLARRPVRIVMYDEVDKYPVTREGLATDIGDERTAKFPNWLSIRVCSPTVKDASAIEDSWLESDQRRASVECPHCGHRQFPDFFKHVDWRKENDGRTHKPETAAIHCEACHKPWSEGERRRALATIRWHQTRPFECCGERQEPLEAYHLLWTNDCSDPVEQIWDWWSGPRHAVYRARCSHCGTWPVSNEHAGFQAGKLYSPWAKDAPSFQAKKWLLAQGNEDKKQVWWNTQAAWPYQRHTGKQMEPNTLLTRRENWPEGIVPEGVAIITAGIDTQDYRVEIEVVGWGFDEESWSIEHHVIDGEMSDPATVAALDAYLRRVWYRADGRPFEIKAACHDSGGHHADAVYAFSRERLGRRIWAIRGESAKNGKRSPIWPSKRPTSRTKKTFQPIILGVNTAKDTILLSYLPKEKPGPGYMHFSMEWDLGAFEQLTAERQHIEGEGKDLVRKWMPIAGRANERLDCRVYALAALRGLMHFGLKLNREAERVGAERTWTEESADDGEADQSETADASASPQPPPVAPAGPVVTVARPAGPKRSLGSMLAGRNRS